MLCRYSGLTFIMATILGACASSPADIGSEGSASNAVGNDPMISDDGVSNVDYLSGADPESINKCRKEATTGTYVKRIVCGPIKDDRELLHVITSPPR